MTPLTLQRKRHLKAVKKTAVEKKKGDAAEYATLLALRIKEKKEVVMKRRKSETK